MGKENNKLGMWSASNESITFMSCESPRKWSPLPLHIGNGVATRARPSPFVRTIIILDETSQLIVCSVIIGFTEKYLRSKDIFIFNNYFTRTPLFFNYILKNS